MTLGIPITFPSTEYGYLQLSAEKDQDFYHVLGFKEKPDYATAMNYFKSGHYRWNSGMFIWRADTIIAAFHKYVPDLAKHIDKWENSADFTKDFAQCEKISIDYAIMEKTDNIIVVS